MSLLGRISFCLLVVAMVAACARHDDLPAPLPLALAPTPEDFTVTTSDFQTYDLSWTLTDPSAVSYYRLYLLNPITFVPELADTTAATAVQVHFVSPTQLATFGVSSVTFQNVEGAIVFASADTLTAQTILSR